jgi:hypothetical protein
MKAEAIHMMNKAILAALVSSAPTAFAGIPDKRTLAMRDPAMASLMGVIKGDQFGVEFGDEYEFGAEAQARSFDSTQSRERLLEPNKGSTAKIQRYAFGMSQTVTLSTAEALDMDGNPDTHIRPQRVTVNAPIPGFATISAIKVANVGVIVGGEIDAFDFAANGQDQQLDVPTLSPANKVRVTGAYSGLLPSGGYVTATDFKLIVSFKGPAKMVA